MTLKTIAKVNKLDAGTPSCTQPPKPFSIVSMQYSQHCENISKKAKNGLGEVLWRSVDDLQGQISACLQRTYICIMYTSQMMT